MKVGDYVRVPEGCPECPSHILGRLGVVTELTVSVRVSGGIWNFAANELELLTETEAVLARLTGKLE